MTVDHGFDDKNLITIDGIVFVVTVYGAWIGGRYIPESEFSPELRSKLLCHHADNLRLRLDNIGEE